MLNIYEELPPNWQLRYRMKKYVEDISKPGIIFEYILYIGIYLISNCGKHFIWFHGYRFLNSVHYPPPTACHGRRGSVGGSIPGCGSSSATSTSRRPRVGGRGLLVAWDQRGRSQTRCGRLNCQSSAGQLIANNFRVFTDGSFGGVGIVKLEN